MKEAAKSMSERRVIANAARMGAVGLARVVADVAAILAGFACAYETYLWVIASGVLVRPQPVVAAYWTIVPLFALLVVAVFAQSGLYQRRASILNLWELQTVVKGIALASTLLFSLLFFVKLPNYSRLVVVGSIVTSTAFLLLERRIMAELLGMLYQGQRWMHRVLICGSGTTGRLLMKKIVQAPQRGWTVVGFLDDGTRLGSAISCRVAQNGSVLFHAPVLGRLRQFAEIVAKHHVDEVLVTVPNAHEKLPELFQTARQRNLRIGVVPHLEEVRADQLEIEDVSAIPVMRWSAPSRKVAHLFLKRGLDLAIAPLALLLTTPFWLVAAVAIRLTSPGGIFFVQERCGLDGRRFKMFKFRTMWRDARSYDLSPHGDDSDARITGVGRFLRKTGIDELPQLLNVIRGDMSLVGPRPEMPFLVEQYGPLERQRLLVKPGITGLWQLGADRHAEIHENLEYDLYYISNQSLLVDFLILLETVFFTVAQATRSRMRTKTGEVAPRVPSVGVGVEPYFLVALDQRQKDSTPGSWQRCLTHLDTVAKRGTVKILVSGHNSSYFDPLLEQSRIRLGEHGDRVDYAFCDSNSDVRVYVAGATVVLTDLPNIARWAQHAGVGVINLHEATAYEPSHGPVTDAPVVRKIVNETVMHEQVHLP